MNLGWQRWSIFRTSGIAAGANKPSCKTRHGNSAGSAATSCSSRRIRRQQPQSGEPAARRLNPYYAFFHLLIEDAALRWQGSLEARTGLERAFDHGPMKNTSMQFRTPIWQDWHGIRQPVPPALQKVASAFVDLQEERHKADYDNHEQWSATEVHATLNTARSAFHHWQSIRTDPMAGNYLLAMLLKKQRS